MKKRHTHPIQLELEDLFEILAGIDDGAGVARHWGGKGALVAGRVG
jgi:hypothetical protein